VREKKAKNSSRGANGAHGSHWIRPVARLAIYLRDGLACAYCGRDLHGADPADVTLDHLDARHCAGRHRPANLVTACRRCNSSRQDRPWREYATAGAVDRIARLRRRSLARYRALAGAIISGRVPRDVAVGWGA
jgi:5-methylcytosine-specific restriction endonuclease McrA